MQLLTITTRREVISVKKEKYEELEAEVLSLEDVDVITASESDPTETNNH